MELAGLRAFVKVAELGNISQAATALGLTQPSVSRTLFALEREFGSPLFYRTGRGVTLTEVGEAAFAKARSILINSEQLVTEMRNLGHAPSGVVTVALLPSFMRAVAADLFEEVKQKYPGVVLRMLEGFTVQNEDWLADGRADIALVTRYRDVRGGNQDVLAVSNLMLVGSPRVGSAGRALKFRQLAKVPLVLPAVPNGLRVQMDDVARRLGVALQVVSEADSLEAQKAIISRQRCYAVLSEHTVLQERLHGMFETQPIVEPKLPRYVILSTTTHHPLSRAAREVARVLQRLVTPH
jgi:LysR family nitrogen assimilation transcriptional regulator